LTAQLSETISLSNDYLSESLF